MGKKLHLYHISQLLENQEEIKQFVPRIPESRANEENETIPRVCVSDSLEGCFKGHPDAVVDSEYGNFAQLLLEKGISGLLFRVYHFIVDEADVMLPEELLEKGYVPDVLDTNEHWILTECQPVGVSYVCLEKAGMDMEDSEEEFLYTTFDRYGSWGVAVCRWDFAQLNEDVYDGLLNYDTPYTPEQALQYAKELEGFLLTA